MHEVAIRKEIIERVLARRAGCISSNAWTLSAPRSS